MLDLDHFKQIDDLYGHGKGDEVLAAVGVAFRSSLRASDFAGRHGILLPEATTKAGMQLAQNPQRHRRRHHRRRTARSPPASALPTCSHMPVTPPAWPARQTGRCTWPRRPDAIAGSQLLVDVDEEICASANQTVSLRQSKRR